MKKVCVLACVSSVCVSDSMLQYYRPLETIDDYLSLFVQMADQQRGVLTKERLVHHLQTSLTAAEMEQLLTLIRIRPNGSVDYTGLVSMLFEL